MENKTVIQSYVWHGEKCFFVSTIERDSSAMVELPLPRYNETITWEYDYDKKERGSMICMGEDRTGSIASHFEVCIMLSNHGEIKESDDNED